MRGTRWRIFASRWLPPPRSCAMDTNWNSPPRSWSPGISSGLRVSIGASDMNERVYSYDDLPAGETDVEMAKLSLGPDRADVIPVLKEILAIRPGIKILGSPWSAPAWMKTNDDVKGGELKSEY